MSEISNGTISIHSSHLATVKTFTYVYMLLYSDHHFVSNFVQQPQAETDKEFMLSTHKLHIEASLDKEVSYIYFCLVTRTSNTHHETV